MASETKIGELLDVLAACEDYFDNRADADCDQDGFIPNEEMLLLGDVRRATAIASALSAPEKAGEVDHG